MLFFFLKCLKLCSCNILVIERDLDIWLLEH